MNRLGSGDCTQNRIPTESESLLKKYDIPVDHLDFKYVKSCKDANEIEKILHILQSGQEGYYPDLIKCTEKRLEELNPNSKHLRKQTSILTKADLGKDEWNNLTNEVENWVSSIKQNDQELRSFRNSKDECHVPIRDSNLEISKKAKKKKDDRIKSMEYEKWDKLDVDAELLKLEIKEEKELKEHMKKQEENEKLNTVVIKPDYMTDAELTHAALQEKNRGNEFYRQGEYEEALQYYSNSLNFQPNPVVYNNRAITYIKLNQYENALKDTKEVLKLEPTNEKALLRQASSLKHLKKYDQALECLQILIRLDPNNNLAQSMMNEIVDKTKNKMRSVRMVIKDENTKMVKKPSDTNLKTKSPINKKRDVVVPIPGTSSDRPPYYKVLNVTQELEQKYLQSCKKTHHPSDDNVIDLNGTDEIQSEKETVKETIERNIRRNGGGEPHVLLQDISPYEFIKKWQNIRSDKSLRKLEQVLRGINPKDLVQVIGNKLDGQMLSLVLQCLEKYFMTPEDSKRVSTILTKFSKLPRFQIVAMLLNNREKQIASNIIRFTTNCGHSVPAELSRYLI